MPRKLEPLLANRIREARTTAGLSQEELAGRVQVTRQTIIALEGGAYTPSLALALRLAAVFDRAVEQLFWFETGS
jgi:putative transcriptional regulator